MLQTNIGWAEGHDALLVWFAGSASRGAGHWANAARGRRLRGAQMPALRMEAAPGGGCEDVGLSEGWERDYIAWNREFLLGMLDPFGAMVTAPSRCRTAPDRTRQISPRVNSAHATRSHRPPPPPSPLPMP